MRLLAALDKVINKHLHSYEHGFPRWDRGKRWHWNRVVYDRGPVFWCLAYVWWIPGLRWLYVLRCRNVSYRLERHNQRLTRNPADYYDWSGTQL